MTSCYSFFRRKGRPRSEAYTSTDFTYFPARGGNRPDSLTAHWLGRAPIPQSAYCPTKVYEKVAKQIGRPYDPHPKHNRVASSHDDYQRQENDDVTQGRKFNSKQQKASTPISKAARQKKHCDQAAPSCSREVASSSSDLNATSSNTDRDDAGQRRLRRTSSQPVYRIERSLFQPVSVSCGSFRISSARSNNTQRIPLRETCDNTNSINEGEVGKGKSNKSSNQTAEASIGHAQSSARPKAKIRIIRMISTPLPHSSNEPQVTVSASQERPEINEQNNRENGDENVQSVSTCASADGLGIIGRPSIPLTYTENCLNQNRGQTNSAFSRLSESEYEDGKDNDTTYPQTPVFRRDTRVGHSRGSGVLPEQARRCIDYQRSSRPQLVGVPPPSYNSIHREGSSRASWHNYLRPRETATRRLCNGQRTCCDDYIATDENQNSGRKKKFRFRRQQSARYSSSRSRSRTTAGNCRTHSAQVTAVTVVNDECERATSAFCYRSESSSPQPSAVALPPYSVLPQSGSPPSYEQAMSY